jgi:hypothetical protein
VSIVKIVFGFIVTLPLTRRSPNLARDIRKADEREVELNDGKKAKYQQIRSHEV